MPNLDNVAGVLELGHLGCVLVMSRLSRNVWCAGGEQRIAAPGATNGIGQGVRRGASLAAAALSQILSPSCEQWKEECGRLLALSSFLPAPR